MSVLTSAYASDALPGETVDAVVIGGGAAAGALAAAHINALLATAETDAALAAALSGTATA